MYPVNDQPKHQPRDLVGYGGQPPKVEWANGAKVAVSFVLNFEGGAENNVLYGDLASEAFLSDMDTVPMEGQRHMSIEWLYEYGTRAGFWRLMDLFKERDLKGTIFGVAASLDQNPAAVERIKQDQWEVASHGYRWINYQYVGEEVERAHVGKAIEILERLFGKKPVGWYTGRNSPRTRQLVHEVGDFLYDSDAYNDDLPYWELVHGEPKLIIPYTLENNDMKFASDKGFTHGEQFTKYIIDGIDQLIEEGETSPKMMSIGLHSRIIGTPSRARALARVLDYIKSKEDQIWVATREEIARYWHENHPYQG